MHNGQLKANTHLTKSHFEVSQFLDAAAESVTMQKAAVCVYIGHLGAVQTFLLMILRPVAETQRT